MSWSANKSSNTWTASSNDQSETQVQEEQS
jgi:hypothetical protein